MFISASSVLCLILSVSSLVTANGLACTPLCCSSVLSASDPAAQALLGLLGIPGSPTGPIGSNCKALGLLGSKCTGTILCCMNNSYNGAIAYGCVKQ
ncbi:hypothetical protein GALMADRAFT_145599 [Galerina marginata CBS 339.88]|uniref:Hydrophobin n=1 Tax=Galerina marginata (strain CBS 339.88) TaxID=685588 RepID=A0A067SGQ1_GALM3|nr:hypothetical protein GALMADRAFT_145599 [Galerina marginata CBS 339.88]